MTPKSLLRLPAAASTLEELNRGGFRPLINDAEITDPNLVERVVLCSGKVFYDLNETRKKARGTNPGEDSPGSSPAVRESSVADDRVAIVRCEQFYPFPLSALTEVLEGYPNAKELVWCQEEPKNMGGWTFMEPRLENLLSRCERPRYVGREASASPATGNYAVHTQEQQRLVTEALTID
jgi:2-oxoglutarate dehydrogenase E1 component